MTFEVFSSEPHDARGVVVVAHGLNMKPEVMDELVAVLTRDGLHCVRISLYHEGLGRRVRPDDVADGWIGCVRLGYQEAKNRFPELPVYCLAFSVGALITLRFLDVDEDASFDRMMLLAPPVGLTFVSRLVRYLVPLWRVGLVLPSAAPRSIRARGGTPFSEYGALLIMHDAVQSLSHPGKFRQTPTRIIVDQKDELVSYEEVLAWLDDNELHSWTADLVRNRASERRSYKHLIVTAHALGPVAWSDLVASTLEHLDGGREIDGGDSAG